MFVNQVLFCYENVAREVMYYTPGHLCPGCSTSLLTILWKPYFGIFDMGHVFGTIIWNMGAILWLNAWSIRMTWGWSEVPGIERKPAFHD